MVSGKEVSDSWCVENILKVGFKLFSKKCKLGKKFVLKLKCWNMVCKL